MTDEHPNRDITDEKRQAGKDESSEQSLKAETASDQVDKAGNSLEDPRIKLEAAEEKAAGYLAQLTRLQADFVNFRRRIERERGEQVKYANEQLLGSLLPVVDNLERALKAGEGGDPPGPLLEGVAQILKQFLTVLEKEGATPLDPGIGQPFNPEYQEALMREEGETEVVVQELLRGWRYRDRVLRPTLVKVGPCPLGEPEAQVAPEATGDVDTTNVTAGTKEVTREDG